MRQYKCSKCTGQTLTFSQTTGLCAGKRNKIKLLRLLLTASLTCVCVAEKYFLFFRNLRMCTGLPPERGGCKTRGAEAVLQASLTFCAAYRPRISSTTVHISDNCMPESDINCI